MDLSIFQISTLLFFLRQFHNIISRNLCSIAKAQSRVKISLLPLEPNSSLTPDRAAAADTTGLACALQVCI